VDEEAAMLFAAREELARFRALVTYNGASFDLPYLRVRLQRHRLEGLPEAISVDLLPPARRTFKGRLPSCKLDVVEAYLRGSGRKEDVSGAAVPAAYHAFLRSGDGRYLEGVLRHNRSDLVALALLLLELAHRPEVAEE
jgi:hypothetical protein